MKKLILNRRIIVIVIIVIVLIIAIYQIFIKREKSSFVLFDVVKGNVVQEVSETGQVQKGEEIGLNFKTTGRIESVAVKAGDKVVSGQELARLDARQLQIQLEQANAALNVIEAQRGDAQLSLSAARQDLADTITTNNEKVDKEYKDAIAVVDDAYLKGYNAFAFIELLKRTYFTSHPTQESGAIFDNSTEIDKALDVIKIHVDKIKANPSKENIDLALNELEGKVLTIRDQLEQARITIETSGYRDIVSTTDKNSLDTYKLNINTAYSNLLTAKADIALAKANADDAINSARSTVFNLENQLDVSQNGLYEAQVKEARAKVQLLMEQIRDVTLKSPVDGKVVRVNKKAGETAQAGSLDPVVSVLPLIPFEVDADIYEEDVVLVSVGNNVDIYLIPFPEKIFKGKVVSIDPAEKAIEGVIYYEVNIAFEEEIPESLKPGMTADVNIKTGTKQDVIIIPEDAITRHNGKSTVNVSKNGRIQEREVILGLEGTDGMVEIISGLQVGEKVVIEQ